MELKYTPRTINEIEVEKKRPIQDVLAEYSISTMLLFVKKGLGVDEEKAYEEMEKFLSGGKDTMDLYVLIMEALQSAGFLPRQLNLQKIKEGMKKELSKGI